MSEGTEPGGGFVAKRVREGRRARGWSREQLADRVGVDPATVGRWEDGVDEPRPGSLAALAEAFDLAPYELAVSDPERADLRDLRVWAGLTSRELADRIGVSHTSVIRYEQGHRDLTDEQLVAKISDALEVAAGRVREAAKRSAGD